jgi:hypothetical protein
MSWPLVDLALARRLEHAEGAASAAFVDARARMAPAHGATWIAVDGVRAMFDGVGSPLTQTFGLGLDVPVSAHTLTALERFFADRDAAVDHEVSPLAEGEVLPLLTARGYAPIELTDVLCRPLTADDALEFPTSFAVSPIAASEGTAWADAAADGWSDTPEVVPFVRDLGAVYPVTAGATCYAAFDGTTIAGAGVLAMHQGTALLAGASTRPAWRQRGAQTALLAVRLRDARRQGGDLAMICARPGSASHRNAQRRGFRVAYTRIKWHLDMEPTSRP